MPDFNYYKSREVYREKYYQMPKVFFTNPLYKNLSNDAKIAYMLLKDRFDYSVQNEWVDQNDNIYFIFTISELMNLLNCREGKINKIKKELEIANLLRQEKGRKRSSNGTITSTPNRLYLGKPNVEPIDIFMIKEMDKSNDLTVNAKIANTVESYQISDSTVNAKIANTVKANDTKQLTVNAKIADNLLNNNNLDTNRHLIDTDKDQLQNQILLENFVETCHSSQVPTFVPDKVLGLIATFSPTYEIAQQTVKTIHNAKYKAEEQTGITIAFEDLEQQGIQVESELYQTLLKAYQKNRTEKVNDLQSLIFVYVRNWFIEKPIAIIQQEAVKDELPEVMIDNWIK